MEKVVLFKTVKNIANAKTKILSGRIFEIYRNLIDFKYLVFVLIIGFASCNKTENGSDKIFYAAINKEYVFQRDLKAIASSREPVSMHIDSIISGLINTEVVSTGNKSFDLNGDNVWDLGFEIIDLNKFNINKLPLSFDSLAVRVLPNSLQVLDNSTYGYPDALDSAYQINSSGNWTSNQSVIGTFTGAGQFKGKGEKYLGIRLIQGSSYLYGWIKLFCSEHNDTIRIIDYAYNQQSNKLIMAGQKE